MQQQTDWLSAISNGGCAVTAGYRYCLSGRAGVGTWNASNGSNTYDQEADGLANISVGIGIGANTTLGLVGATGWAGSTDEVQQDDAALAIGSYLMWSQSGDYRTGANLTVSGAASTANLTFKRGVGLNDVQIASEETSVQTLTAATELSYGISALTKWTMSPTLGIRWSNSQRDGYSENGNLAFSAEYDDATEEVVTGSVGLQNFIALNEQNTIQLGIGAEYDLYFNAASLRGTSDVPTLNSFDIEATLDRNNLRGFVNAAHVLTFDPAKKLTTSGYLATPTYGTDLNLGATVALEVSF